MKQLLGRYLSLFLVALVGIMPAAQAAQQTINRGTTAGDGTGETLYSAFGRVSANFDELYSLASYQAEKFGASASAAASVNTAAFQAAINRGGTISLTTPGTYNIDAPLLIGSDTRVQIAPGVTIRNNAANYGVMIRTGNAEFAHAATSNGIAILAADTQTAGVGQILYQTAPARLSWKAPSDSSYGTPVDVSTSPGGKYTLESGAANKALHVAVATSVLAGSGGTYTVKVSGSRGAVSAALVRASGVVVATEVGHGRRSGDMIQIYGDSAFAGTFVIEVTGDDTYTYADARSAASSSGARAYGLRNISILATGATFDAGYGRLTGANNGVLSNAIVARNVSGLEIVGGRTIKTAKYGILVNACANYRVADWTRDLGSDTIHLTSPLLNGRVENVTANGGDNVVGIGTSDYAGQIYDLPSEVGFVDVENLLVRNITGINSSHDLVRFFGAAPGSMRNVTIDGVHGTFDSTATAAVRVMTDTTLMNNGTAQTNIERLTIRNVTASGANPSLQLRQVYIDGAGTKDAISIDGVRLQSNGTVQRGGIWINGVVGKVDVSNLYQASAAFQGTGIVLGSSASLGELAVRNTRLSTLNTVLSTSHNAAVLYCDQNAAVIDKLVIDDVIMKDTSASGALPSMVYLTNQVKRITANNIEADGTANLIRLTGTVATTPKVNVSNVHGISGGSGTNSNIIYSQAIGDFTVENVTGTFAFGVTINVASGTAKIRGSNVGAATYGSGRFLDASGGATFNAHAPDGTALLSQISRTVGNMVKSSTALGTIPAGALAVCDDTGTTNSWKAVHNTSLTY